MILNVPTKKLNTELLLETTERKVLDILYLTIDKYDQEQGNQNMIQNYRSNVIELSDDSQSKSSEGHHTISTDSAEENQLQIIQNGILLG